MGERKERKISERKRGEGVIQLARSIKTLADLEKGGRGSRLPLPTSSRKSKLKVNKFIKERMPKIGLGPLPLPRDFFFDLRMNEEEPLVNINSSALLLNRNYFDGPLLSFHVLVHLYHKHLWPIPATILTLFSDVR